MRQQDWNTAAELLAAAMALGKPEFAEILSNKLICHANQPDYEAGENLLDNASNLFSAIEDNAAFRAAREIFVNQVTSAQHTSSECC
jgi:hypothetical protein